MAPFPSQRSRAWKAATLAVVAIVAALGLSGCPALIIPGLGIEAAYHLYKYQKSRSQSPAKASPQTRGNAATHHAA
jgi:hypothetical protein